MERVCRVVVAEKDNHLRNAIRHLAAKPGARLVVAEYASSDEALLTIQALAADILTVALDGVVGRTRAIIASAKAQVPAIRILAIGTLQSLPSAVEAVVAGADACLMAEELGEHLAAGLLAIEEQRSYLGPAVMTAVVEDLRSFRQEASVRVSLQDNPLSRRERQVLQGLAEYKGYKEIAGELGIGPGTARWYANQARAKLHVNAVSAAVQTALRSAFISVASRGKSGSYLR